MRTHELRADNQPLSARLRTRGELTAFLMRLAGSVGADHYMLVALVSGEDGSEARPVASNWIHDAIELTGARLIGILAAGPLATPPGQPVRTLVSAGAPALAGVSGEEAKLLDVLGHAELVSLRLPVGRLTLFLLLSSGEPGQIACEALTRAQMLCCYALSQVPGMLAAAIEKNPLSERERECLLWVSEGKTTDEIGLILGVSPNTVNSYVTHAIRKVSSANRAMAIATAIRSNYI